MKYHTLIICILAVAILYPSKPHAFDYPNDQPTIEAQISLHKLIKKRRGEGSGESGSKLWRTEPRHHGRD